MSKGSAAVYTKITQQQLTTVIYVLMTQPEAKGFSRFCDLSGLNVTQAFYEARHRIEEEQGNTGSPFYLTWAQRRGLEAGDRTTIESLPPLSLDKVWMFENCLLNDAYFAGLTMKYMGFRFCKMHGVDLRGATLMQCDIRASELDRLQGDGLTFQGATLADSFMLHGSLHGVRFDNVILRRVTLDHSDLRDVQFSRLRGWENVSAWSAQGTALADLPTIAEQDETARQKIAAAFQTTQRQYGQCKDQAMTNLMKNLRDHRNQNGG